MALSGHLNHADECPLPGANRTLSSHHRMSESDPIRTFSPSPLQFAFPTNRAGFGLILTGGHAPFGGIPFGT
jgi:hypothetical protein